MFLVTTSNYLSQIQASSKPIADGPNSTSRLSFLTCTRLDLQSWIKKANQKGYFLLVGQHNEELARTSTHMKGY